MRYLTLTAIVLVTGLLLAAPPKVTEEISGKVVGVTDGVWKDRLIARLGPEEGEAALREPFVREFDITGRAMRNWVAVEPEGVENDGQLTDWIQKATDFVGTLPRKTGKSK